MSLKDEIATKPLFDVNARYTKKEKDTVVSLRQDLVGANAEIARLNAIVNKFNHPLVIAIAEELRQKSDELEEKFDEIARELRELNVRVDRSHDLDPY